ncbi:MAG: GNAT family N-acetyltransferase [Chloroflexi bacterium]|nr:GNAT family N-acetyltransferase [Chloroflexota bacterium]
MEPQPVIHTVRLRLRPLVPADAPRVRELAGEREVAALTTNIPHPYEAGMAERWIAIHLGHYVRGELATWAVTLSGEEPLMGAVSLHFDAPHNRAEASYWLGQVFWGYGYAPEAVGAAIYYAFEHRGLQKITASVLADNQRSVRVMEKLGFVLEGRQRRQICKWEAFHDLLRYGLLREEFAAQRETESSCYYYVKMET